MVKRQSKAIMQDCAGNKVLCEESSTHSRIISSAFYDICTERLSRFGGLLGLIKFLDLLRFKKVFDCVYQEPTREPKPGHYRIVVGTLMLLFIGFNRLWHFVYIRLDTMVCGFLQLPLLPAAGSFWRYMDSLSINQAKSILEVGSALRERA